MNVTLLPVVGKTRSIEKLPCVLFSWSSPYQWLLQQRIVLAQRLLETSDEIVERVATCCGFCSAATFRLHFQRFLCISPQAYRNAFRSESSRLL